MWIIVLLSIDRLTAGVWGSKTRTSEGVEKYNRETPWANGAWEQLTCTHTTYWGGEWVKRYLFILYPRTNFTNSVILLLCQPCPKKARQETKAEEEYERYLQTAESALKALQAIDGPGHSPSPPEWVRTRLQALKTLITQINTTTEEQPWFNHHHLYLWLLLTQYCLVCSIPLHLLMSHKIFV